jgi:hypothetical protein
MISRDDGTGNRELGPELRQFTHGRVLDRRTFKGFGRRWSRWPVVQSAVGDVWTLIASKSAWARRNMACLTGVETIEINEGLR